MRNQDLSIGPDEIARPDENAFTNRRAVTGAALAAHSIRPAFERCGGGAPAVQGTARVVIGSLSVQGGGPDPETA